jgi:hypothetical protein
MFCTNCGTNLSNDTLFCTICGAKVAGNQQQASGNTGAVPFVEGYQSTPTYGGNQYPQKSNNKKTIMIAGIAAAAFIFIVIIILVGKSILTPNYNKPIKYMVKGMQNGDFDLMMKAYPDFMKDQIEESLAYYSDDINDFMKEYMNTFKEQYGDNFVVTYKIVDKEKLDSSDVESLEEEIEYTYDEKINIDEIYELDVELSIKGSDGEDSDTSTFTVFKVGSKWYIMDNILG